VHQDGLKKLGKKERKVKKLIIAIHDVSPAFFSQTNEILKALKKQGISKVCLKVIPDYLGKWNIIAHPQFVTWLHREKEKGCEIIQHGYRHQRQGGRRGLLHFFRAKFLTQNQDEFSESDYVEAKEALQKGKEILATAGFECEGFTAPTWFQSRETKRAIIDLGFAYFTLLSAIFDCRKGIKTHCPALGNMGLQPSLERLVSLRNWFLKEITLKNRVLMRIVLHPQGTYLKKKFPSFLRSIHELAREREVITYSQWIKAS